jgi:hypothetical protein
MRRVLKKQNLQPSLTEYPMGTYLKTESGYFYVYSNTYRYPFATVRVLESWSPQRIVKASETDPVVKRMKVIGNMKFRDGSLLYSQADGKMYLVSDKKVRHITNPDVLTALGARRTDAVWVSLKEIKLHETGEELN